MVDRNSGGGKFSGFFNSIVKNIQDKASNVLDRATMQA